MATLPFRTLSVVIPVFNESPTVARVLSSVVTADCSGLKLELVVIDDASTDTTAKEIAKWQKSNPKVAFHSITHKVNQGKGAAVKNGILKTTGDIVLIQDADLEYSPEEYPLLLEPFLTSDADAVYGSRFISSRPHRVLYFWHYVANLWLTCLSNALTNLNLTDMETGAKAFRGELIRQLAPQLESQRFGFEPEITARLAKVPQVSLYEVGITYRGRRYEDGKKITWQDGVRAVWEIIKYNLL
jgi:glycosyltransferase involved in cell wall biosynthesis